MRIQPGTRSSWATRFRGTVLVILLMPAVPKQAPQGRSNSCTTRTFEHPVQAAGMNETSRRADI